MTKAVPFWKDERKLAILFQAILLAAVVVVLLFLGYMASTNMAARNLKFSFGFLSEPADFQIYEGYTVAKEQGRWILRLYHPSDQVWQAMVTGFLNTLRVSFLGIVLTTVLGVLVGIGRLSSNWLVNRLSFAFVELIRNTPLLVQMVFWYLAVFLLLPPLRTAPRFHGLIVSNKGVLIPWPVPDASWATFAPYFYGGLGLWILFIVIRPFWKPPRWLYWLAPTALWGLGLILVGSLPLEWSVPQVQGFRVEGGMQLSPEFSSVLLALVLYTASYIAEIVRGAIQSLPKGQWEAPASLGLSYAQTLRLIILPQAMRIVIPPLGNQYLNLTKNSSLAIAIAFPEIMSVYETTVNQAGHSIEGILIVMAAYLSLSLFISALINWYNVKVALVGVAR
ncbi:ABC transporter permease subunit [Oceanithermus sp.]|uniref:amino acid ABC transporter permease n=1 Tax=Oceanithermus sp. TaxID=2268145 RepID=UPI00257B817F|nr:ABC transporter permease subunit [Oceanithermus sp.]